MKRSRIVNLPCPYCRGTGKGRAAHLQETLDCLRRHGPATAATLAAMNRAQPTAFNNRLEDLRALGMVSREKIGKAWLYRVIA